MRTLCQVFAIAAFGLAVSITGPVVAAPEPQSDERAIAKAFNAAKNESWTEAFKYAERAGDPLTVKVIEWLRYQRIDPKLKFSQIAGFIEANPTWPRMSRLRRSAEAAVGTEENAATIIDWFERYPPLSGVGALAHLDALVELGRLADARALVPKYWKDLNYTRAEDKAFQRKYGRQLANADHIERLDRLIWDQKYWPARRMLPRVGRPPRRLLLQELPDETRQALGDLRVETVKGRFFGGAGAGQGLDRGRAREGGFAAAPGGRFWVFHLGRGQLRL